MSAFKTWSDYLYPREETGGRDVLRNLFGERDPDQLSEIEYAVTTDRSIDLMLEEGQRGEPLIPRTYDAEHLSNIHRHLMTARRRNPRPSGRGGSQQR